MRLAILLLAAVGGSPALSAQTASFTNYGRGCDLPGNPPPVIRATGSPRLGTTFTLRYIGPNGQTPVSNDQPVLLTGFGALSWPIPAISNLQPANCLLLVQPDIAVPMPWTGSRYLDQVPLQIPNDPGLMGATLYQQFVCVYSSCRPTCNVMMLRTSDAATVVLGT